MPERSPELGFEHTARVFQVRDLDRELFAVHLGTQDVLNGAPPRSDLLTSLCFHVLEQAECLATNPDGVLKESQADVGRFRGGCGTQNFTLELEVAHPRLRGGGVARGPELSGPGQVDHEPRHDGLDHGPDIRFERQSGIGKRSRRGDALDGGRPCVVRGFHTRTVEHGVAQEIGQGRFRAQRRQRRLRVSGPEDRADTVQVRPGLPLARGGGARAPRGHRRCDDQRRAGPMLYQCASHENSLLVEGRSASGPVHVGDLRRAGVVYHHERDGDGGLSASGSFAGGDDEGLADQRGGAESRLRLAQGPPLRIGLALEFGLEVLLAVPLPGTGIGPVEKDG